MAPSQPDTASIQQECDILETQLQGHLFLGGCKPSQEDVETFNRLFGEQNVAFFRWVRNMASFTPGERETWGKAEDN